MSMEKRSYEKELLDQDNIPFDDILINLQELNTINTILGGHKTTCTGVEFFLNEFPEVELLTIAEIGCGGGDNLRAVDRLLRKWKQPAAFIGIDIKAECIKYARQHAPANTEWICSDYKKTTWPGKKPDIIFSSLFCHHFTDEQIVGQLRWLKENCRLGFFINDLHRHPLAYQSIKLFTRMLSKSYLVKNDAPLSVMRGFKKREWIKLLSDAGISAHLVKWQWAFRYLIIVANEQQ
jgi:2-polyprenyl-3-methyl-5-hydroxy-6-metoxy-1,4-benzoquinol methylase